MFENGQGGGSETSPNSYTLVDTTIGSRILLAFRVSPASVQKRLPHPWVVEPYRGAYATSTNTPDFPNLFAVFNDLLLNRDASGKPQADPHTRYVGFNIPARNAETGTSGMVHFRIFTGTPESVPGRYKDALPATVVRESWLHGTGRDSTVFEDFTITSASGGHVKFQLEYQRGALLRLIADRPNFPVWAAADPTILRVYQEDALMDTVLNAALGVNHVRQMTFQVSILELGDLFDGNEQLLAILVNPSYARRVFHQTNS